MSCQGIGTVEDEIPAWLDMLYIGVTVLVGHRRAAQLLLNRYEKKGALEHLDLVRKELALYKFSRYPRSL